MPENRKKSSKPKEGNNSKAVFMMYFVVTFIISVFVIGFALNYFSPTVDVNIGQTEILPEENEQGSNIDDRLKWIQDEDNYEQQPTSERYLQNENELNKSKIQQESIRPDKSIKSKPTKKEAEEEIPLPVNTKYITVPPVPTINEVQNSAKPTAPNTKVTKVYIGFYNSSEEAQNAKNQISQSVAGVQPFVKAVNGQYIVQAGSFGDRRKAVELKETLNSRGYNARLISD